MHENLPAGPNTSDRLYYSRHMTRCSAVTQDIVTSANTDLHLLVANTGRIKSTEPDAP